MLPKPLGQLTAEYLRAHKAQNKQSGNWYSEAKLQELTALLKKRKNFDLFMLGVNVGLYTHKFYSDFFPQEPQPDDMLVSYCKKCRWYSGGACVGADKKPVAADCYRPREETKP